MQVRVTGLQDVYSRANADDGADMLIVYTGTGQPAASWPPGDDASRPPVLCARTNCRSWPFGSTDPIIDRLAQPHSPQPG